MSVFPSTGMQPISPLNIHSERFQYIDYMFNYCLTNNFEPQNIVSPSVKVCFIETGTKYTDRMFVAEDYEPMVLVVRNITTDKPSLFNRVAHIIVRSKINYVHFSTGSIFKDLFDYSFLEPEEIKTNIYFYHNEKTYDNIGDIAKIDEDFKMTTRVFLRNNNMEIGNNLFYYSYTFKYPSTQKIGYYILPQNYEYLHVITNIPTKFGEMNDDINKFNEMLQDPNKIFNVLSYIFGDVPSIMVEVKGKNGKSKYKETKVKSVNKSLIDKVNSTTAKQEKVVIISWFLCEIMFKFFYDF